MATTESTGARPTSRGERWSTRLRADMARMPGLDYLMLRIIIFLLVGIGVLMVFSSSMVDSYASGPGATVWDTGLRQSLMVMAGLVAFWLGLRMPPRVLRMLVPWILIISLLLLVAVLFPQIGTGREEVGSQSWIVVGGMTLQPSEFARIAIGLFGASVLADKNHVSFSLKDPFMVYSGIAALMFLLILGQGDLGMAMSFAGVVIFTLFFAGVDWRFLVSVFGLGALGLVAVFLAGGFRSSRFHTYFDALRGDIEDTQDTGFQAYQGFLSLADGGVTGVGIGQSRAKWFYLPEAKNDFVFAIVGEEMGLWGGALVIILFAMLGFFGIRTAMRAQSQFQGLVAATLTAGVVSQAFFNIGYVVGLLPVTGIQLPMISAGGTSAIITIGSMGLLANVARHEPPQISAMQSYGRPLFDRILMLPEPRPAADLPAPRGRARHAIPHKDELEPVETGPSQRSYHRAAKSREARFGQPVTRRGSARGSEHRRAGDRPRDSRW